VLTARFIFQSFSYACNNKNSVEECDTICLLADNMFVKREWKLLKVIMNAMVENLF
jgi:hypothetical protein